MYVASAEIPHTSSCCGAYVIKHRDNFTFLNIVMRLHNRQMFVLGLRYRRMIMNGELGCDTEVGVTCCKIPFSRRN
jgi:hypothetical protein